MEEYYGGACGTPGRKHVWILHAFTWFRYNILSISLEGKLVKTLLSILGVVYLFTPWSFCMVETLIDPHLPRLFLLEVAHLLFCGLTISSYTFIHGFGCFGTCT